MVRPATPGTIIVLAATVVLVLVTVSTPIIKSIYFLQADLTVSISSVRVSGNVNLGVFGYCVTLGSSQACQGPQLGYELSSDELFGNTTGISLPNSLIKWLTYALIIHPIAAGLAALSLLLGVISHFREFSRARMSTWIASIGCTIGMLAFVFDIVLFSIAKSRINSTRSQNATISASLGNGVWLTLAGFVLLLMSSCFFGFGTRISRGRPTDAVKDSMRPRMDQDYASQARRDARDLEMAEANRRANGASGSGLPAFPEEEVPLTSVPKDEELEASEESNGMHAISGVGMGYGRGPGADYPNSASYNPNAAGLGAGGVGQPHRQPSNPPSAGSRAEPFVSMHDEPIGYDSSAHVVPYGQGAGPYPRRQGSGATTTGGFPQPAYDPQMQRQAMGYVESPAPMGPVVFPSAEQYGGREPSNYYPRPDAPTYPPTSTLPSPPPALPPKVPGSGPMHSGTLHRPTPTVPWIPPIETSSPIDVAQGQSSFYSAAAAGAAQHRSSNSISEMGYLQQDTGSRTQQYPRRSMSGQQLPSPQEHHPGALMPSYNSRAGVSSNSGASPAGATVAASPPYANYEYYNMPSPTNDQAPATIPYAPQPSVTPAPTYYTHQPQPYASYGGNVQR